MPTGVPVRHHSVSSPGVQPDVPQIRALEIQNNSPHWHHNGTLPTRFPQVPTQAVPYTGSAQSPGYNGSYPTTNQISMKSPQSAPPSSSDPNGNRFFSPPAARVPSPVREIIANQMHAQRDKIRQESKFIEMEDELRRRRELMGVGGERSPVNGRFFVMT